LPNAPGLALLFHLGRRPWCKKGLFEAIPA